MKESTDKSGLRNIEPVKLSNVRVTDSFWRERQCLMTDVTIPYMEKILRDQVEGAEKSHAIQNFRIAAGLEQGEFYGMVFQDSDVYKWLEAAAYSLYLKPDAALEKRFDEISDLVGQAQQPDGYINTWFTIRQPGKRWTDLLECHELYCAGHLFEAAAAAAEVLGKTKLLEISERFAQHIISVFMDSDAIPGHEEVEIGLMRLYRVTGKREYLRMAAKFLENRGQDPQWFQKHTPENPEVAAIGCRIDPANNVYNQSDLPVRAQTTSRGHAVRMMYLMTALADTAVSTGDTELYQVCDTVFRNTVERKMAVTGGIGARVKGESFGDDWELPNDSCYNETCASIAMAFFTSRMLSGQAKSAYADILERELYNGALSGMQLDGKRFFYVNPLEADPERSGIVPELKHALIERPQWYGCACCPPNLARLITSLGQYIYGEDGSTVYVHQFIGSSAQTRHGEIVMTTEYPWNCRGTVHVRSEQETPFSVAIRIPDYAGKIELLVNGKVPDYTVEDGYAYILLSRCGENTITFDFNVKPKKSYADSRIVNNRGHVAVSCGPLIYCAEEADNRAGNAEFSVPQNAEICVLPYDKNLLNGIVPLSFGTVRLIPYYAWSNRGKGKMKVWLPEQANEI